MPSCDDPEEEAFWKHSGKRKQEDQDGPGSLTWVFEITLAIFFFGPFQRRVYKNFLMSVQCK